MRIYGSVLSVAMLAAFLIGCGVSADSRAASVLEARRAAIVARATAEAMPDPREAGEFAMAGGEYRRAAEHYSVAIEGAPEDADALFQRGAAWMLEGELYLAADDFAAAWADAEESVNKGSINQ